MIERLNQEIAKALKQPDVAAHLARDGTDPVGSPPKEFAAFMKSEHANWVKVAQKAGIAIKK